LFFFRWFKWSGTAYLVVVCFLYFGDAWMVHKAGKGILESVGWVFFFPKVRDAFVDRLVVFSFGWWMAAFALLVFMVFVFDDLERLNNLGEEIRSSEERLGSLKEEIGRLSGELQRLEERRKSLKTDIDYLEQEKAAVWDDLEELEERRRNLTLYIEETLRKAYEEGKEKGYRSVLDELRSLRVQKSIVLDLFDNNEELKRLFKRLTGKTIRQYLREEKKRRLEAK